MAASKTDPAYTHGMTLEEIAWALGFAIAGCVASGLITWVFTAFYARREAARQLVIALDLLHQEMASTHTFVKATFFLKGGIPRHPITQQELWDAEYKLDELARMAHMWPVRVRRISFLPWRERELVRLSSELWFSLAMGPKQLNPTGPTWWPSFQSAVTYIRMVGDTREQLNDLLLRIARLPSMDSTQRAVNRSFKKKLQGLR